MKSESVEVSLDTSEMKVETPIFCTQTKQFPDYFELERLDRFSSWNRMKRAVAACIMLKTRLKEKQKNNHRSMQVTDVCNAEMVIIKLLQSKFFAEELKVLQKLPKQAQGGYVNRIDAKYRNNGIKQSSTLYRLDPFLDVNGIIRVGGRMRRAEFDYNFKHPIILPRKHHITRLIVRHFHELVQHQGRGLTTNEIRSNGFWVLGCSSAVSTCISECVKCRRYRGPVEEQKMANLPEDRLLEAPPFTYCAVDLFGPWYIKEGRKEMKRYGVLFTCFTSRAVHIETTRTLETDSFINALRRFISIRGPIRQLRCDRGTNFVGAQKELFNDIQDKLNNEEIKSFLLKRGCDYFKFSMNFPASSHMGVG